MDDLTQLLDEQLTWSFGDQNQQSRNIEQAQESIYNFLLDIVKQWSAEVVLQEFIWLFIQQDNSANLDSVQAINELIAWNNESEFYSTLKRCCYILINNWKANKKEKYIYQLVETLSNTDNREYSNSPTSDRLKNWMQNFVNSKDYEELKLFASKCQGQAHWKDCYTSNLLVPQSNNLKKPIEQQQTAQNRAKALQYRSKFDLAMYMARSPSTNNKQSKNPTQLGNEVLRLIKMIVAKRDPSSYANIANIFIKQNKHTSPQELKQRLYKYLIFSTEDRDVINTSKLVLSQKLSFLNEAANEKNLTVAFLPKTCNRIIDCLTTENHRTPSPLFSSLISQGNHMTLVIVLLKIILICKVSRTHLQACIAELSHYYEDAPEIESKSVNNFIEIYKVMFAIYVDNVSVKLD